MRGSVRPHGELPVSAARLLVTLALCTSWLALGCGDDSAGTPVSTGHRDGGRDSGLDGSVIDRDGMIIDDPMVRPDAGPRDAAMMPSPDEDADVPTCRRNCAAMETECMASVCNERTLECDMFAKADGLACGSQELTTCSAPDSCKSGVCEPHHQRKDVPCGDQDVACHRDDACDGQGHCVDNGLRPVGTACGDATSNACNGADTCNAAGECDPNYAVAESPCGDQGSACHFDDVCDGSGTCVDRGLWEPDHCPSGVPIGPDGRCGCGRGADGSGCMPGPDVCVEGACVPGYEHYAYLVAAPLTTTDDLTCGSSVDSQCDNPDSCLQGVCASNAEPALTACGDPTNTTCNGADSCDGFGNCNPRLASGETVCGVAPGECFQAPRCNGSGSCLAASAKAPNAPCGDSTATACNGADACDGFGTCLPNLTPNGTACNGSPSGACDVQDECDGAGHCQALRAAPGTVCGDADEECANPDTCNAAGTCVDNGNLAAGQPCGSSATSDCDLADSCDGNGVCATHHVAAGQACGDPPFDCFMPNSCDGSGTCAAGAVIVDCRIDAGWVITDEATGDPLSGVTVEVVGSDPLESSVTDGSGVAVLSVPVAQPFHVRTRPTATHWGRIELAAVLPGQTDLLSLSMQSQSSIDAAFSAAGLATLSPTNGILETVFYGYSYAGGEASILSPTCAPGTCGPITQNASAINTISATLVSGGSDHLSFVNLAPGSYGLQMNGKSGVSQCVSYDTSQPISVLTKTVTSVWADCSPL